MTTMETAMATATRGRTQLNVVAEKVAVPGPKQHCPKFSIMVCWSLVVEELHGGWRFMRLGIS